MPLSNYNSAAQIGWSMTGTTTTGFPASTEGGSVSWTMNPVTVATWNQLYATTLSIAHLATSSLVLTGLTNLVGESFSFAHVVSILVAPTVASITIGPGASNPLTWFFSGSTATIQVNAGGIFLWSDVNSATGQVVDGTHKQLDFINVGGSGTASVQVVILGRTT